MFRKEDNFFFILNDGCGRTANNKECSFPRQHESGLSNGHPNGHSKKRIQFVCASFMWISEHRMPSGEITQGNSLVKKQSKAPVCIEAEHQTLAIELSVYV